MSLDTETEESGIPVVYDGEAITLSQGEGAWVPVVLSKDLQESASSQVVLASVGAPVELVPGIWDSTGRQGMVCVMVTDALDVELERGTKLGEVHPAAVQTRVCQRCGGQDTDAWLIGKSLAD